MYTIARTILKIARWLWPVVLIPLIAAAITTLIPLFVQAQPGSPLYAFLTPGPVRNNTIIISITIFGILILAPFVAWLILLTEGRTTGNKVLRQYLHAVEEAHLGLNPKGFAQQSALISVNVPLDVIFIHLNAVSDRPLYDLAYEQQKLLEELRSGSHHDLTPEQREEHIQRLRVHSGGTAAATL